MPEENQSSFKITDRRLFNSDGTLREEALEMQAAAAAAASAVANSAAASSAFEPEPDRALPEPEEDAEPEQTMFTEFLMGVASSAFIYLGMVEHPATGRRQIDMGAAKESIDMLTMLREKTKGNLTRGEEKFFADLLSDLHLQYISIRR